MNPRINSKTIDLIAISTSFEEVIELLVRAGLNKNEAIELVDDAFKMHKLNLSCFKGSYV